MKKLLRLLPFLLVIACGKSGPAPQAPKIQDVPVQVEATGEADPIAAPEAVTGGSFTTWGGGYPKSLNVWLDNNSFSGSISGLMFEDRWWICIPPRTGRWERWRSPGKSRRTRRPTPSRSSRGQVERRAAGYGGGRPVLLRRHHEPEEPDVAFPRGSVAVLAAGGAG